MIFINYGKTIKLHRIKKGWTQEELAMGLISISYLSKIENEQLTAGPDIIESLLLRLDIQDTSINENELIEEIKLWYLTIVKRDTEKYREKYCELAKKIKNSNSFYVNTFFSLISIRYFSTIGIFSESKKLINELSAVQKDLTNELLFYFHKFKGGYEYLNNQIEDAYHSYKQAEILFDSSISPFEHAEVFYSLGLITTQLFKPYLGIFYTNQAIELFRNHYYLDRCCDCHLLLGILFLRLKEYDESLNHFQWASKLAKEIKYQSLIGITLHNLGYLYDMQGQFTTALQNYEKSLEIKEENKDTISSKLTTIICIAKLFFKQRNQELLIYWLDVAEPYISTNSLKNKDLYHEYQILRHLAQKDYEEFIYYTTKVAIPYFEKEGFHQNTFFYSNLLGEHFKENRKYKLSSYYFEFCKDILSKKI